MASSANRKLEWNIPMRNILVLCKTNAARSIMVEACVDAAAAGKWRAYSAGSHPEPKINAYTLMALREQGFEVDQDRKPQGWAGFLADDALRFDVVLTVCEDVSWEKLPAWPGAPRLLHWALPDPSMGTATPTERADIFRAVLELVQMKVADFLAEERNLVVDAQANDNRGVGVYRWGT